MTETASQVEVRMRHAGLALAGAVAQLDMLAGTVQPDAIREGGPPWWGDLALRARSILADTEGRRAVWCVEHGLTFVPVREEDR